MIKFIGLIFHFFTKNIQHECLTAGRDKCVLLWSIEDHITTMQEQTPKSITPTAAGSKQSGTAGGAADTTNVYTRGIFKGHTDTVEDVQFRPSRFGLHFYS